MNAERKAKGTLKGMLKGTPETNAEMKPGVAVPKHWHFAARTARLAWDWGRNAVTRGFGHAASNARMNAERKAKGMPKRMLKGTQK